MFVVVVKSPRAAPRPACRPCHRLGYESQLETPHQQPPWVALFTNPPAAASYRVFA